MNILYVYAHPQGKSLNASIFRHGVEALQKLGAVVKTSNLYELNFKACADDKDFTLSNKDTPGQYFFAQEVAFKNDRLTDDINAEIEKLKWADHIIFQFPLWWFSTPAILKGWFDRVLIKGFAYDAGKTFEKGLLAGKTASITVTTQSPESAYQKDGAHGAGINSFLFHIHHTLRFVGIKDLDPFVYYAAFNLVGNQQVELLNSYDKYLRTTLAIHS